MNRVWLNAVKSAQALYRLRDLYTTDLAVGAVNGTAAEPGPGTRTATDTGGKISITGGKLSFAGGTGTYNQTVMYYNTTLTRLAGMVVAFTITIPAVSNGMFGAASAANGVPASFDKLGLIIANLNAYARFNTNPTSPIIRTLVAGQAERFYIVHRLNGRYVFCKELGSTRLLWFDEWINTGTLYASLSLLSSTGAVTFDDVLTPSKMYQVNALASDSFNRADSATLGTTDGAGHAEANSGSGLAWTNNVGTFGVASNVAQASALTSGVAIATVDVGNADHFASVKVTRAGGLAGVVLRYVDANNYIIAYHDGTNLKVKRMVGGALSGDLLTVAAPYAAGGRVMAYMDGTECRALYDNAAGGYQGGTSTINDAVFTGVTRCGMYTTDVTNTLDYFAVFARGGYTDLGAY